jgi:molybdopterin-guanine dinucleotide biosynthesis protein MobB
MTTPCTHPPIVAIIGRKNSGKTTLTVALAAAMKARGLRVASLKHGHHDFQIDEPGRDSWRHFHEGGVEAVIMASSGKVAMVMRTDEAENDPVGLIRRLYGGQGYDVVLVEGFKHGPFPKIEIFRTTVHPTPIFDPAAAQPHAPHLAIVTDAPEALRQGGPPVIALRDDGSHVDDVVEVVLRQVREVRR